jgi:hypothetical protein
MQYMLLIYDEENALDGLAEDEVRQIMMGYFQFTEELEAAGALVSSDRLRPVATATTVRIREGDTMTTDGPFAETKEQLGGYYIIDVPHLDEAIRWAGKIPSASFGSIEVRPIWPREEYEG